MAQNSVQVTPWSGNFHRQPAGSVAQRSTGGASFSSPPTQSSPGPVSPPSHTARKVCRACSLPFPTCGLFSPQWGSGTKNQSILVKFLVPIIPLGTARTFWQQLDSPVGFLGSQANIFVFFCYAAVMWQCRHQPKTPHIFPYYIAPIKNPSKKNLYKPPYKPGQAAPRANKPQALTRAQACISRPRRGAFVVPGFSEAPYRSCTRRAETTVDDGSMAFAPMGSPGPNPAL